MAGNRHERHDAQERDLAAGQGAPAKKKPPKPEHVALSYFENPKAKAARYEQIENEQIYGKARAAEMREAAEAEAKNKP